jgi:hypothetical protein
MNPGVYHIGDLESKSPRPQTTLTHEHLSMAAPLLTSYFDFCLQLAIWIQYNFCCWVKGNVSVSIVFLWSQVHKWSLLWYYCYEAKALESPGTFCSYWAYEPQDLKDSWKTAFRLLGSLMTWADFFFLLLDGIGVWTQSFVLAKYTRYCLH